LVFYPPFEGDAARGIVQGTFTEWNGPSIRLGLEPLTEPGTRVIVPFLDSEAIDAFRNGEFARWLQRCWWRAIQVGELEITLTNQSGTTTKIEVPKWWAGEPWRRSPLPEHLSLKENVQVQGSLRIKRIVLLYDPSLHEDEIEGMGVQYEGVQLLRGRQWIETLGASEKFGDLIPPDKRPGFRGFVEFDRRLDQKLREIEKPQHDHFSRLPVLPRQIDAIVKDAVREFAEAEGWSEPGGTDSSEESVPEDLLRQIADIFYQESGSDSGQGEGIEWDCALDVLLPNEGTTRVEWGERLTAIKAKCSHRPTDERLDVSFELAVIGPSGETTAIAKRDRKTRNGTAGVDFEDITIVNVSNASDEIACPSPGKYRLKVTCSHEGEVVASSAQVFFVRTEPPAPPPRTVGVSLQVRNPATNNNRVNYGESLFVEVAMTYRGLDEADVLLDVSFESLLLDDSRKIVFPPRRLGDDPYTTSISYTDIFVYAETAPTGLSHSIILQPGKYLVRADVKNPFGEVIAHASAPVFIEIDPNEDSSSLPFDVKAREDASFPYPIWELEPPHGGGSRWTLWFALHHPIYQAMSAEGTHRGNELQGLGLFWAETYCGALVEYALRLYLGSGDEAVLRLVRRAPQEGDSLWERYCDKLDALTSAHDDPLEYPSLLREVTGIMLYYLEAQRA
jgi:hypothetical protein